MTELICVRITFVVKLYPLLCCGERRLRSLAVLSALVKLVGMSLSVDVSLLTLARRSVKGSLSSAAPSYSSLGRFPLSNRRNADAESVDFTRRCTRPKVFSDAFSTSCIASKSTAPSYRVKTEKNLGQRILNRRALSLPFFPPSHIMASSSISQREDLNSTEYLSQLDLRIFYMLCCTELVLKAGEVEQRLDLSDLERTQRNLWSRMPSYTQAICRAFPTLKSLALGTGDSTTQWAQDVTVGKLYFRIASVIKVRPMES